MSPAVMPTVKVPPAVAGSVGIAEMVSARSAIVLAHRRALARDVTMSAAPGVGRMTCGAEIMPRRSSGATGPPNSQSVGEDRSLFAHFLDNLGSSRRETGR